MNEWPVNIYEWSLTDTFVENFMLTAQFIERAQAILDCDFFALLYIKIYMVLLIKP